MMMVIVVAAVAAVVVAVVISAAAVVVAVVLIVAVVVVVLCCSVVGGSGVGRGANICTLADIRRRLCRCLFDIMPWNTASTTAVKVHPMQLQQYTARVREE